MEDKTKEQLTKLQSLSPSIFLSFFLSFFFILLLLLLLRRRRRRCRLLLSSSPFLLLLLLLLFLSFSLREGGGSRLEDGDWGVHIVRSRRSSMKMAHSIDSARIFLCPFYRSSTLTSRSSTLRTLMFPRKKKHTHTNKKAGYGC